MYLAVPGLGGVTWDLLSSLQHQDFLVATSGIELLSRGLNLGPTIGNAES